MRNCCHLCKEQASQELPHLHLKLLSKMNDSSIFRCGKCEAFWLLSSGSQWELLIESDTEMAMCENE